MGAQIRARLDLRNYRRALTAFEITMLDKDVIATVPPSLRCLLTSHHTIGTPVGTVTSTADDVLLRKEDAMVHYHGGPFSDPVTAVVVWRGRHAMISFARPDQIKMAADICQSFCLDNGAFSVWRRKAKPDFARYYSWLDRWIWHPGCDFAVVPDCIQGTEDENDELLEHWPFERWHGCAVWHMHESLRRLRRLTKDWPRVAIGSSGTFDTPGSDAWWNRMNSAMQVCCDASGTPRTRLHGLRMLNPELFGRLPLSSADSTNVCRNVQLDSKWIGPYVPASKRVRGLVLVDRIESHNAAPVWSGKAA